MFGIETKLPPIPSPSERRIALRVTAPAEQVLRQGHPWVYENSLTKQSRMGQPGDLAVVFDRQEKFLAIGLYDPTSVIRVRVLQHRKPAKIDRGWFTKTISEAKQIRDHLPSNTNAYRIIHGENDRLPGLIVDSYAHSLVLKLYTPAWIPYLQTLITILVNLLQPTSIILRLSRGMLKFPEYLFGLQDGSLIYGTPLSEVVLFTENGITFEADLVHGQKTGFFLDQRDNRAKVENISAGKRVLNVFSYTGGFSIYAARGGAPEVTSIDVSQPALAAAQRNFALNQTNAAIKACRHHIQAGDAFEVLRKFGQENQTFDMLIIDPPSFAKQKSEIDKAIAAYQRLTRLGLGILASGGIFVQSSCSSRVSKSVFFEAIHHAAKQSGRPLREIERTGHALDHPIGFPEGEYLKCLFAFV